MEGVLLIDLEDCVAEKTLEPLYELGWEDVIDAVDAAREIGYEYAD